MIDPTLVVINTLYTENKVANNKSRYDFIRSEGQGGGKLDFSYTGIPKQFPGASKSPMNRSSPMISLSMESRIII